MIIAGVARARYESNGFAIGTLLTTPSDTFNVLGTAATARIQAHTTTSDATLLFTNGSTGTGFMGVKGGRFALVGGTTGLDDLNAFYADGSNRFGIGGTATGTELFSVFDKNTSNSGIMVEAQTNGMAYVRLQSVSNSHYMFMDTAGGLHFSNSLAAGSGFGIDSSNNALVSGTESSFYITNESSVTTARMLTNNGTGGSFELYNAGGKTCAVLGFRNGTMDLRMYTDSAVTPKLVYQIGDNFAGESNIEIGAQGNDNAVIRLGHGSGSTTITSDSHITFNSSVAFGFDASLNKLAIAAQSSLNSATTMMIMSNNTSASQFVFGGDLTTGGSNARVRIHNGLGALPSDAEEDVFIAQNNDTTTADAAIAILAGTSGSSALKFGNASDIDSAIINYDHSTHNMTIGVSGTSDAITITNAKKVGFNVAAPISTVEITDSDGLPNSPLTIKGKLSAHASMQKIFGSVNGNGTRNVVAKSGGTDSGTNTQLFFNIYVSGQSGNHGAWYQAHAAIHGATPSYAVNLQPTLVDPGGTAITIGSVTAPTLAWSSDDLQITLASDISTAFIEIMVVSRKSDLVVNSMVS